MLDFDLVLGALASKRPVFHSEADFQHALAWELHLENPNIDIRIEYPPPWLEDRFHLDLWIMEGDTATAVELKYLTQRLDISLGREQFNLRDHSARDLGRYYFVKDIERLERVVAVGKQFVGYAIILTNDPGYWENPTRTGSFDAKFRIQEGRVLSGRLDWDTRSLDPIKSIQLTGSYPLEWRDYSTVDGPQHNEFRYALVKVSGQK